MDTQTKIKTWTNPRNGNTRIYVNGHDFCCDLNVWLERNEDGTAEVKWSKTRGYYHMGFRRALREFGFGTAYDAALHCVSRLSLECFDTIANAA